MECRRSLVLGLGLLTAVGCTHPFGMFHRSGSRGKPEEMVHQASTYVAFAEYRATSGFDPAQPPAAQQQLREDARTAYGKALQVDPRCLHAWLGLARLEQRCENYPAAVQHYQKTIDLEPRDGSLWYELAVCQCRQRDYSSAVEALRTAVDLSPSNRQYQTTLGYTQAKAGRMDECFATLKQAHGEARAHLDLARIYRHMNQAGPAREHLARSLAIDPSSLAARRLREELDAATAPPPEVRRVEYQPPAPATVPPPPPPPAPPVDMSGKPLAVPPLPVIVRPAAR